MGDLSDNFQSCVESKWTSLPECPAGGMKDPSLCASYLSLGLALVLPMGRLVTGHGCKDRIN